MIRTKLVALTLALAAAASTSTSVYAAWPGLTVHQHPDTTQDSRITIRLYNPGLTFRDVQVDGHTYTIQPHQTVTIKAPAGTAVYAGSTGAGHRKGDLLFAVTPALQDKTLTVNAYND
jgi:hypothetical protein